MSDLPFVVHPYDSVPLDRNVVPLPECKVIPVLQNGKVIHAVDVPILGCSSVWLRCQSEAERWISDCDAQVLKEHPELMNARINAAYAYLWLTDQRFQWAGLAAFASKQVGCGFLHSARIIAKGEASRNPVDQAAALGARHMKEQLAIASRNLFLDIYPLHRFYTLRGIDGIRRCLVERQSIRNKIKWDVQDKLPFGVPFTEIRSSFEAIERNDIAEGARLMLYHEQINVLQRIFYDIPANRVLLDGNQAAWVIGLPSGMYQEVQLTLSAQCRPKSRLTRFLDKSLRVKLYDAKDRMQFVYQAADDFQKLLHNQRPLVTRSLEEIYLGRGVR